jgi:hypothetical protein
VTVKLELKPEIEAVLAAQAHARGLSLESYLDHVLQSAAAERAGEVFSTQAEAIRRAKESGARPRGKKSLAQLFAESPFKGLDLKFERDPDMGRPVEL